MKLNGLDLKKALLTYGIKKYSHSEIATGIANLNLRISTKQDTFVLRIYQKKKFVQIRSELNFMHYLQNNKIPVPKIIRTLQNEEVIKIGRKYAVLFSFIEGNHVESKLRLKLAKDIGSNLAKMHVVSLKYKPDIHIKKKVHDSLKIVSRLKNKDENYFFSQKDVAKIQTLKLNLMKMAWIHSDLIKENILVKKDKLVAFIDFDDFHEDFLAWDVAVAITHLFITRTHGIYWKGMEAFLEEYFKAQTLTMYEKKYIVLFMKLRNIELALLMNQLLQNKSGKLNELVSIKNSVLVKLKIINGSEIKLNNTIFRI